MGTGMKPVCRPHGLFSGRAGSSYQSPPAGQCWSLALHPGCWFVARGGSLPTGPWSVFLASNRETRPLGVNAPGVALSVASHGPTRDGPILRERLWNGWLGVRPGPHGCAGGHPAALGWGWGAAWDWRLLHMPPTPPAGALAFLGLV